MVDCFTCGTTGSTRREFLKAAGKAAVVLCGGSVVYTVGRASGQVPDLMHEQLQKLTQEEQSYYVVTKGNLIKKYD